MQANETVLLDASGHPVELGAPPYLTTSFRLLRESKACVSGYKALHEVFRASPGKYARDTGSPFTVAQVLHHNGMADALWVLRNATPDLKASRRFERLLAVKFAEHVLEGWTRKYQQDRRPAHAIDTARAYALGNRTDAQLALAHADVWEARKEAWHAHARATSDSLARAYALAASAADSVVKATHAPGDESRATAYAGPDELKWQKNYFKSALAKPELLG